MATNMPPHHLGETIDAVVAMIDDPNISVEGLMKHIKGPDFPTGAIVVGRSGIRDAYRTGRGRIVMRARAHIEELRGGRSAIVVTELPYGVKKGGDTGVIVKIADLVRDKVLTEVADLADHSDRTGMRIQIELKRDAIPQVALNKLFKHALAVDVRLQRRRARRRRSAHPFRCSSSSVTTSRPAVVTRRAGRAAEGRGSWHVLAAT
jgi:DNA gyrase subunit A